MEAPLKMAVPAVFILIIIAISLMIGGQILGVMQSIQHSFESKDVANETVTNGSVVLGYDGRAFDGIVLNDHNVNNATVIVTNCTDGSGTGCGTILAQNTDYNFTNEGELFVFGAGADATAFNVTYTYTDLIRSSAFNASGAGLEGIDQVGTFQPTMAVVVAMVIVMMLLVGSFAAIVVGKRQG